MTDLPKITGAENGPLIVENPPSMKGATQADPTDWQRVALCRRGASANKPFCHVSHHDAQWSDDSSTAAD